MNPPEKGGFFVCNVENGNRRIHLDILLLLTFAPSADAHFDFAQCVAGSEAQHIAVGEALEQFQLLHYWIVAFLLLPEENFHTAELLVGDAKDSDTASFG